MSEALRTRDLLKKQQEKRKTVAPTEGHHKQSTTAE
jgi:hypothetical protein